VTTQFASASPVAAFVVMLAVAATLGTIVGILTAAGEEIGWRGYMLTRLIDAGIPYPVLASGVIWGLWHVPIVLGVGYAAGPSPAASAVLLVVLATAFGVVFARLRLQTGSVWPAIVLHGAWNSIIQSAFDAARTGGDNSRLHDGASWWVGESGVLTVTAMIIAAVVFSQGRWALRRRPDVGDATGVASTADQPQSPGPTVCAHDRHLIPWRLVRWRARYRNVLSMLGRIIDDLPSRLAISSVVTGNTPLLPAICQWLGLILGFRSEGVRSR
jgi:membrane protease YdiL (CAAX protease family)